MIWAQPQMTSSRHNELSTFLAPFYSLFIITCHACLEHFLAAFSAFPPQMLTSFVNKQYAWEILNKIWIKIHVSLSQLQLWIYFYFHVKRFLVVLASSPTLTPKQPKCFSSQPHKTIKHIKNLDARANEKSVEWMACVLHLNFKTRLASSWSGCFRDGVAY